MSGTRRPRSGDPAAPPPPAPAPAARNPAPARPPAQARRAPAEPRPRRAERKEAVRAAILDSARAVFFRDGFMPANLDEVADRADVAKGTLYRYFDSKAELYVAVLARDGARFEEKMRATLSPELDPVEQIRRTSRFYLRHWTENPAYFSIFWAVDNESVIGALPSEVVESVTALWESCLQILADVIERGTKDGTFASCDAWEVANVLWTIANGLLQSDLVAARRKLRRVRLERVFDDAVDLVLRGLSTRLAPR